MRIFIFLLVLKSINATNPKAINVELKTVLEFNEDDKEADVKFIGDIQKILSKVKSALNVPSPPSGGRRNLGNGKTPKNFKDFIIHAINILQTYDDNDLEDAFLILDEEIRKYHYKGCLFYEVLEESGFRKYIANILDHLKGLKATVLRRVLQQIAIKLDKAESVPRQKKFLHYLNSLYTQDSDIKFSKFLNNLETYSSKTKRANLNLIQVFRDGFRSVIFDHYTNLNSNVKKDIRNKIKLWSDRSLEQEPIKPVHVIEKKHFEDKITTTTDTNYLKMQPSDISKAVIHILKARATTRKRKPIPRTTEKTLLKYKRLKSKSHSFRNFEHDQYDKKTYKKHMTKVSHDKADVESEESTENEVAEDHKAQENLKSESVLTIHAQNSPENDAVLFINLDDFKTDINPSAEEPHQTKIKFAKHPQRKSHSSKYNSYSKEHASEEGMSIEFNKNRRFIRTEPDSRSSEYIRNNFIRRINNLEKQMKELINTFHDKVSKNLPKASKDLEQVTHESTTKDSTTEAIVIETTVDRDTIANTDVCTDCDNITDSKTTRINIIETHGESTERKIKELDNPQFKNDDNDNPIQTNNNTDINRNVLHDDFGNMNNSVKSVNFSEQQIGNELKMIHVESKMKENEIPHDNQDMPNIHNK